MEIKTIVTHPGGAHKDDFLACSLLVARHGVPIFRRDPSEEELVDPTIAVVDVGHFHEPEKNNFDHHQFPRDHPPTCALTLVMQHMGIYEDGKMFCDWLEPAEWFDTRGPQKTAEWLGVKRDIISKMNSPIDMTVLRRFSKEVEHQPGEVIYELMKMIGSDLIEYLAGIRARLDLVSQYVQRWEITSGEETFSALYLPRSEELAEDVSGALGRYILVNGLENEIAAMVYPDSRGEGFGLARFNDHPKLDFSRVGEEPDVHFAHSSGFLCKSGATEEARLQELLAASWG